MYAELAQIKVCSKCKEKKVLSEFQKDIRYKFGVKSRCRLCLNQYMREKGFAKKYAEKHKVKVSEYRKVWIKKNKAQYDLRRREWVRNNLSKVLVETRKYQAAKLKRIPKWLTMEDKLKIKEFYMKCKPGYEVDHIIPLQGKNVSGLHVPENLQYLKKSLNRSKSNKL